MERTVINLTPHMVSVFDPETREPVAHYPSLGVARVEEHVAPDEVPGFPHPVVEVRFGAAYGVPEDIPENAVLIVSLIAGPAVVAELERRGRYDVTVLAPDAGPASAVRDQQGRVVGITRFRLIRRGAGA